MENNFPKDRIEFEQAFSTDEDCLKYLAKFRWPEGFVCPRCNHTKAWSSKRGLYICASCRYQVSVTAGTIFHRSKKSLVLWFRAIWYLSIHKYGGNALSLQRELGLGSYHTAWEWLHKLRKAMIRPDRHPLEGLVEVDETYVGGVKKGPRGRGSLGKTLVMVAVEDNTLDGFGRIRIKRVPDASGKILTDFIQSNVVRGSTIRTDGWRGYHNLAENGYSHIVVKGGEVEVGEDELKLCHRVISLFKRLLLGTYQGATHSEQLDRYLEEFTFRFNRRHSKYRGLLFRRVIEHAVVTPPFPAKEIELGLRGYLRGRTTPHRRSMGNAGIQKTMKQLPLAGNQGD